MASCPHLMHLTHTCQAYLDNMAEELDAQQAAASRAAAAIKGTSSRPRKPEKGEPRPKPTRSRRNSESVPRTRTWIFGSRKAGRADAAPKGLAAEASRPRAHTTPAPRPSRVREHVDEHVGGAAA
uniref:Uncharacterized protein n=1 Tax=Calcidiscus leptoporus TaxID=127549 RepID=A0A7S0P649_9EUKA|mmetsp:Transcript_6328/g.14611  ORF Transcript_6328/g.14611 Transcript_6328/m.14611 type:complete len:125 (+) Transcript_6328:1494-1868(+)